MTTITFKEKLPAYFTQNEYKTVADFNEEYAYYEQGGLLPLMESEITPEMREALERARKTPRDQLLNI